MAEDLGGDRGERGGGSGGDFGSDELICPTCMRPFPHTRLPRSQGSTGELIEPIPDRPPGRWARIVAAALGATLLFGGTALAAYRAGVSTGATARMQPALDGAALEASSAASIPATSGVPSWDASATGSYESSVTTSPLGSYVTSGTYDSLDASLTARIKALDESLNYGDIDLDARVSGLGLDGDPGAATGTGAPSGAAPGELDLSARATISASSVLAPARGFTYAPANLVDGRGDTCWAEGVGGYGAGQSVTFDFGRDVTVTRIEILPGYDKRNEADRWSSNGRLKSAKLIMGTATHPLSLADERRYQSLTVPSLTGRTLTLQITEAYPAVPGLHAAEDTSIGEIRVYGR